MTTQTTGQTQSTLTPDAGPAFLATMLSPSDPWTLFYRLNFPTRFRLGHYGHSGVHDLPENPDEGWPRTLVCEECDHFYELKNETWIIEDERLVEYDGAGAFGDAAIPLGRLEEPYSLGWTRSGPQLLVDDAATFHQQEVQHRGF